MGNIIHVNFKEPRKKVEKYNGVWYNLKIMAVTLLLCVVGIAYLGLALWSIYAVK